MLNSIEIIKTCKTHGALSRNDVYKSDSIKNGKRYNSFRCKKCQIRNHLNFRHNNREKIKKYNEGEKRKSYVKNYYNKNAIKLMEASSNWLKANPGARHKHSKDWYLKAKNSLSDSYIVALLANGWKISAKDIRENKHLLDFKRQIILIKKIIQDNK